MQATSRYSITSAGSSGAAAREGLSGFDVLRPAGFVGLGRLIARTDASLHCIPRMVLFCFERAEIGSNLDLIPPSE